MIPRILHSIWLGPNKRPKEYADYLSKFRSLNTGWLVREWLENNLPTGLHSAVYERLRQPAERADILRLEILIKYGGVYLDSDMEPLKAFDDLLTIGELVVCELKPAGRVNNAFIAAVPNHPALVETLRRIKPVEFPGLDKFGTGPYLLNDVLSKYSHVRLSSFNFHARTLDDLNDAYVIDHAAASWKSIEEIRSDNKRLREEIDKIRGELRNYSKKDLRTSKLAQNSKKFSQLNNRFLNKFITQSFKGIRTVVKVVYRFFKKSLN